MFFRLYVLIQQNFNTFNVVGVYSYNEALIKQNELSITNPLYKYSIQGPFNYQNTLNEPVFNPPNPFEIHPNKVDKSPFLINSMDMSDIDEN